METTSTTRKRALITGSRAQDTRVYTLHGDQQLKGVCCDQGAASLVASGERHVQIRSLSQIGSVGKLVPFESEHAVLRGSQQAGARYYVSVPHCNGGGRGVRLLDAVAMEFEDLDRQRDEVVSSSGRQTMSSRICNACVHPQGHCVAIVERRIDDGDPVVRSWQLRCWHRTDHKRRSSESWTMSVTKSLMRSSPTPHLWTMRFVPTALFGSCLLVVNISTGHVEWTLFGERQGDWKVLRSQQTELFVQLPLSPSKIVLSPSCRWLAVCSNQRLISVAVDLYAASPLKPVSMDFVNSIADVTWANDDVLAVLLVNGHVQFLSSTLTHTPVTDHPLVTLDGGLDVTRLLSSEHTTTPTTTNATAWDRVLWLPTTQSLVVSAGSCVVQVPVCIEMLTLPQPPQELLADQTKLFAASTNSSSSLLYPPPHRRRRRRRQMSSSDQPATTLNKILDRILSSPASQPTLTELLDATRLTVHSCDVLVVDVALPLLGILLQRVLQRLGFADSSTVSHPINVDGDLPIHIGIMEMLLAIVVTGDARGVYHTAERIVQAPAFRSRAARRTYYASDLQWLLAATRKPVVTHAGESCFTETLLDRVVELVDQVSSSPSSVASLRTQQLQQNDTSASLSLYEDARSVLDEIERLHLSLSTYSVAPAWLQLRALVLACGVICEFYQIDNWMLDLPLLLTAIVVGNSPTGNARAARSSFLRRFLTRTVYCASPSTHDRTTALSSSSVALRLAQASGSLSHVVRFCLSLDVATPHAILLPHQVAHSQHRNREIEPKLSRAVAMEMITQCLEDLVGMLRTAPLLPSRHQQPQHQHDALSIDAFVKLVFVSTSTSDTTTTCDGTRRLLTQSDSESDTTTTTTTLGLAKLVIQQLTYLITSESSSSMDSDTVIARLLSELCLFDLLWAYDPTKSSSTSSFAQKARLFLMNPSKSPNGGQDHSQTTPVYYGRITGPPVVSESESARPATGSTPPRVLQSLRSLLLLLWSHWIREKATVVKAAIVEKQHSPYKDQDKNQCTTAAWCALQLKTLALFRDTDSDHEELLALQLLFLEFAAPLDPETTARVLLWGFPIDSMNARHLKRFRALRAAVVASSYTNSKSEESEAAECKLDLRRAVRRSTKHNSIPLAEDYDDADAVDAFGVCCCDGDFQRVAWALIQRRFVPVAVAVASSSTVSVNGHSGDRGEIKRALQSRASSIDGQISRHEVVQLLKSQRHEIDQQMQRLRDDTSSNTTATREPPPQQQPPLRPRATAEVGAKPAKRYSIRDLIPSSPTSPALPTSPPKPAPLRKGSSTQNVLKLLQLRKDHHHHSHSQDMRRHQSAPRMAPVVVVDPLLPLSLSPGRAPEPVQVAVVNATKTQATTAQATRGGDPRVLPLRRDHDHQAELVLLTTSATADGKKTVPLTRKSFRLQSPALRVDEEDPLVVVSSATQCTQLATTSVQTDEQQSEEISPTGAAAAVAPLPLPAMADMAAPRVECHDAGVQSEPLHPSHGNGPLVSSSLAARFPVYVDLPSTSDKANGSGGSHGRSSFLDVASIQPEPMASRQTTRKDRVTIVSLPQPTATASLPLESSNESRGSQHKEPMPVAESGKQDDNPTQRLQDQRRHTYRSQYPRAISSSTTTSTSVAGVGSFAALKTEMERMKAKLMELETSAQDLDDEFKVSHHKLETMGGGRRETWTNSHSRVVLSQVDEGLAQSEISTDEQELRRGVLSTKATRDIEGARHLLAQLEQLTTHSDPQ